MEDKNEGLRKVETLMEKTIQLASLYNEREDCPRVYFPLLPGLFPLRHTLPVFHVWLDNASLLPEMAVLSRPKEVGDDLLPFIYQDPRELKLLVEVLIQRSLCDTALEIGFARGGYHMLLRQLFSKVVSVDDNPQMFLIFLSHFKTDERSTFVCGDSRDSSTVNLITQICPSVDFLFIDAGTTYESVKSDYLRYGRLVRPGGIIAVHESNCTGYPDKKKLISDLENAIIDGIRHKFILLDAGTNLGTSYEIVSERIEAKYEEKRIKAKFKGTIYRLLLKMGRELLKRLQ